MIGRVCKRGDTLSLPILISREACPYFRLSAPRADGRSIAPAAICTENAAERGRETLPFAEYSVVAPPARGTFERSLKSSKMEASKKRLGLFDEIFEEGSSKKIFQKGSSFKKDLSKRSFKKDPLKKIL